MTLNNGVIFNTMVASLHSFDYKGRTLITYCNHFLYHVDGDRKQTGMWSCLWCLGCIFVLSWASSESRVLKFVAVVSLQTVSVGTLVPDTLWVSINVCFLPGVSPRGSLSYWVISQRSSQRGDMGTRVRAAYRGTAWVSDSDWSSIREVISVKSEHHLISKTVHSLSIEVTFL